MAGKTTFIFSMLIFGSIGLFVRFIPLSSGEIAFSRALIGSLFMFGTMRIKKKSRFLKISNKQKILLFISGSFLGLNWLFLFEAYKRTTITQATILYYTAPILVLIYSFLFLKERVTKNQLIAIMFAFVGLWLTTGEGSVGVFHANNSGIVFGLAAAVCYAGVIIMNGTLTAVGSNERTFFQLMIAGLVLAPYVFLNGPVTYFSLSMRSWMFVLIIGVIHTGIAYQLYFSSLQKMKATSAALMSYIDPLSAMVFSVVILQERMTPNEIIGGLMILLAAILAEWKPKKERE